MKEELPDRYFYNKKQPKHIGLILKELYPRNRFTKNIDNAIRNAWRDIVGDEIFQFTKINGVKKRVLYVQVESTALIHHLTNFERHAIIDSLNDYIGKNYIDDIRFKVGTIK